jgi:hypothetical protein
VSRRGAWSLCLAAGVAVLAITLLLGSIDARACDGVASPNAITRLQWVRSVADVERLFGGEPCRSQLAAALDRSNRIDRIAYIPAFTLFQLFAAWALLAKGRTLAIAATGAALAGAIFDVVEDGVLLSITAALPGEQALIDTLFWYPRLKYTGLACAAACLGLLIARERDWTRWLGLVMIAGAGVALIGLFEPRLLAHGIGAAWTALLVTAALRTFRAWRTQPA